MTDRAALTGRRIVVTRPRAQAAALVAALTARGARVHACPLIRIDETDAPGPLRLAARQAGRYDAIVFTSVNAVERWSRVMSEAGTTLRADATIAAVGPATARAASRAGLAPAVTPTRATGDALAAALTEAGGWRRRRVLIPRARDGRRVVADVLRALGAVVDEVECYRTLPDAAGAAVLRRRLRRGGIDAIAFTSPSQVSAFVDLVGSASVGGAAIGAIGPVTAAAATQAGLRVAIEAAVHTAEGLAEALERHFAAARTAPQAPAPP